jgi:hypothetical protein
MRTIAEIEEDIRILKDAIDKLGQTKRFKPSSKGNAEHLALEEIRQWVNGSHAHLSQAPGYARGYKDGIGQAKEIVCGILNRYLVKDKEG